VTLEATLAVADGHTNTQRMFAQQVMRAILHARCTTPSHLHKQSSRSKYFS